VLCAGHHDPGLLERIAVERLVEGHVASRIGLAQRRGDSRHPVHLAQDSLDALGGEIRERTRRVKEERRLRSRRHPRPVLPLVAQDDHLTRYSLRTGVKAETGAAAPRGERQPVRAGGAGQTNTTFPATSSRRREEQKPPSGPSGYSVPQRRRASSRGTKLPLPPRTFSRSRRDRLPHRPRTAPGSCARRILGPQLGPAWREATVRAVVRLVLPGLPFVEGGAHFPRTAAQASSIRSMVAGRARTRSRR
jgi:hypothetical protein